MRTKSWNARRGFTLIELLVVVAIIALLISILLPSLRDAKEQAKIAKCLAGMRQLMTATLMYFEDYNSRFPLMVRPGDGSIGTCSWTYGGKTSDEYWKDEGGLYAYIPARERPINEYIMGGEIEPDLMDGDTMLKRTEIEPLRCPSDRFSHQRAYHGPAGDDGMHEISSYDDIGTSYHFNLYALEDTNIDVWAGSGSGWIALCQQLVKDTLGGHVSTITLYYEDPMDWAFRDLTQEIGYHGKFNKHTCGFLDGHADYGTRDTLRWCGVGWAAINPNWVYKTGQKKPIYYTLAKKNCNP